ncbi:unnamed protein product [Symbiodinium sp. KB8]|nr:unnamed protein product [Symbiodinium sp. KB8]
MRKAKGNNWPWSTAGWWKNSMRKRARLLHFKMEASQNFSTLAILKEQMELMKNEDNVMRDEAHRKMSYLETGALELRHSLDREEHAKSEVVTRLQQAEMTSGNDNNANLSALHSEVGELRRRLRQQEEIQARTQQAWRQEIEIGKAMPDGTADATHAVNDEYTGVSVDTSTTPIVEDVGSSSQFGAFLASGGYGVDTAQGQSSERANMLRGAQLHDLLRYKGMWRPSMPSSSSSKAQPNIFKETDDDENQRLITRLVEEDVRGADEESGCIIWMNFVQNYVVPKKMKIEYVVNVSIGDKKPNGTDRKTTRAPTNLGPSGPSDGGPGGPGDGDDSKKSPTNRGGPAGGDPPGPPSVAPTDEGVADVTEVKISRREADKVMVPPFPRVTHLDNWMSHCIANVLGACADPNHEEWIAWLNPAFRPNPDIDALNDSGHIKFKSIDIKLGIAMAAMLKAAGDVALDLYLDVNRKSSKYVRTESKLIKGRQIIAMMYESSRTRDRLDMIVTLEYLIKLQYRGDNHMSVFKQTWLECIDRMRPEDVPSDNALRDTLYAKIKESPALKMELLVSYDMLNYDDPKRSYQHLLHLMDRCMQRAREQKMLKQTQNGLQLMIQGKDTLSEKAAKAKGSETATPAPKKPTKPPKNESAAPVLPQSKDCGDKVVKVNVEKRFLSNSNRDIIFYDGEDELQEYEVGPEERKKVKAFSIVNCMVQPTWIRSKIKFLMDTGCGHDLISQRKVEKHGLETLVSEEAISFQTANGVTTTDLISNFQTESFTEPINAYVLDDTPSVLSVGKRCMKQGYGFVWPPGENPFMINPEGKRISLFVNGDIPYVRAGSQKSIAHYDEMASIIKSILEREKEEKFEKASNAVATIIAVPGEEEEPDGSAEGYSPDFIPDEVPREDVPAADAGRPPDPPDEGERVRDDDDREIEVEGEGAPTRRAKIGTLKAEAKTLAHLCTHRYPYCEACIRAKMKHYRTVRGAFKRELKVWGDLITFDFLDMRKAADIGRWQR